MRAIVLVLVFALTLVLGVGCGGSNSNPYGYDPAKPTPVGVKNGDNGASPDTTPTTWDQVLQGNISGVMPGVFRIGNVRPGDVIDDWPDDNPLLGFYKGDPIGIVIYNAGAVPTAFSVTFALPHDPADGYVSAPPDAARWVIVGDPMPIVPARSAHIVTVSLYIPKGVDLPDNWEFAIAVSEARPPTNRMRASNVEAHTPGVGLDVNAFLNTVTWETMGETYKIRGVVSKMTPPTSDVLGVDYFVLTSGGRTLEVYFTRGLDDAVTQFDNGDEVLVTGILLKESVVRSEMRVRWLISMR